MLKINRRSHKYYVAAVCRLVYQAVVTDHSFNHQSYSKSNAIFLFAF